nr:hypothetical protein [Tanacetum cinerariifolium]
MHRLNLLIEEDAKEEEEDPEEEEEDPEEDPKEDDDVMEMDDEANSKIVLTDPMCPNLGTTWKRLGKMEKPMSERIDTKGRIKKKFKEQDRHFVGLDAAIAVATSGINDDDNDTAPMDSQPYEPHGSPRDTQ